MLIFQRHLNLSNVLKESKAIGTIYIILFIPMGIPNIKEAVDRALEKVPEAIALVDTALYNKSGYIPLIFGMN